MSPSDHSRGLNCIVVRVHCFGGSGRLRTLQSHDQEMIDAMHVAWFWARLRESGESRRCLHHELKSHKGEQGGRERGADCLTSVQPLPVRVGTRMGSRTSSSASTTTSTSSFPSFRLAMATLFFQSTTALYIPLTSPPHVRERRSSMHVSRHLSVLQAKVNGLSAGAVLALGMLLWKTNCSFAPRVQASTTSSFVDNIGMSLY